MRIIVFRFLKSTGFVLFLGVMCTFQISNLQAQEKRKISLRQAIDLALSNNLQVRQSALQSQISAENLKQSRFELFPSLNGSSSASRQFGLFFDQASGTVVQQADQLDGNLGTSVPIFQGFSLRNRILQNKALLNSDVSNVEKAKNDLLLSVITTYLQALANRDLVSASHQQLSLSNEQLNIAKRNFDVGNKTLADLSQAKAQVANNELSLTNAQNAFDLSVLELKQLMELNLDQDIELEVPYIPSLAKLELGYTANAVYNQAVENYPDVKVAKYNTEASSYALKAAKGDLYPSLSFRGGIGTRYSSILSNSFSKQLEDNVNKYVGVQLNIPIFNNYRIRSSVNIAKIRFENAKVAEQAAKNSLNKVINQAILDLRAADKRFYATQSALDASKEAFEVTKKRYEVGLVSAIELNTSQVNFNKSEFDFIQAKYDLLFRSKVVDFYLGKPINL
ncbi:outer membrane efflux protein [Pseudopedobacter saltans DSM 12145]|uniref:Outer membrane efflux protein n=1 Tax=Pseudopedobacter saltans (strain ATCC 51119 / DSM 12145 / JCM 21818 / CCUG 39354 / LMG 10337 / NBRC 100064 / NCIMB 13643) TaxID=762903 RepID=F0SES0_PSESL|nr:TolC family protein [Pseudopedobacter saltans]ADY52986.1 outer membrane efflux protein [Pseudopedobacter saltans DSM 12145]